MEVKLTKIEELEEAQHSNKNIIDFPYIGEEFKSPKIGECYSVLGMRGIRTSTITELLEDNKFKTINSIYQIEYL